MFQRVMIFFGLLIHHASLCSLSDGGDSLGQHPPIRQKGSWPVGVHLRHSDPSAEKIFVKHHDIVNQKLKRLTFDTFVPSCCWLMTQDLGIC